MKKNNTNASDKQPETGKTEPSYIVGNSFRMELETVLTNCPECAKSDCKSCGEELKTVLTNW